MTAINAATVFSKEFRDEIDPRDFPHGLPSKSCYAQYREHRQSDNTSWAIITKSASPAAEAAMRQELVARITHRLSISDDRVSEARNKSHPAASDVGAAVRKRKLEAFGDGPGERIEMTDPSDLELRTRKAVRRAHVVLVPQSEVTSLHLSDYVVVDETEAPQRTPKKNSKRPNTGFPSPPNTIRIFRCMGPALDVSARVHAEIEAGYTAPSEREAHPPLSGLFYRFWDPDHSQGRNSESGFVAKRYVRSNAVPVRAYAPPAKHLDPTDLWNHLNAEPEATPLVSVSDSLVWSLSKLLRLAKSGAWKNARLSVIDAHKLAPGSVFHAAAFYRQLNKLRSFTNGAHRGVSSHEFLVFRDVPESAMIQTLDVGAIFTATANSADLARMLRLDVLAAPGSYQTKTRPRLQQGGVRVAASTAACMAHVARLLGLRPDSSFEQHRHLVSDLVSSYKMVVEYRDPESWREVAGHYVHRFCRESAEPVALKDQGLMKLAFLEGVRLGASYDFKLSKIDGKKVQSLQRKARLVGLDDPCRIVCGEADAVKLHVGVEQRKQWKMFECRPSRMLLEDIDDDSTSVSEMGEDGAVL